MTLFTRVGACIWDWEPFVQLPDVARVLWLGLYTSAFAKACPPGMFRGSIGRMAEASRQQPDDALRGLDKLLDDELVEYDRKFLVLRMTELPDAGEYPSAPTIIDSWWTKFNMLPRCQVRDSHVEIIRWILDQGATTSKKNRSKKPTALHEETWAATFGTVVIPPPRRRGIRRLIESDTSTDVQPSLFGERSTSRCHQSDDRNPSYPHPLETLSDPPKASSISDLVPDLMSDPRSNDSSRIYTLSRGCGVGEGAGVEVGEEESGSGGGTTSPVTGSGAALDQALERSRSLGPASAKPHLALVPPPGTEVATLDDFTSAVERSFGGRWAIDEPRLRSQHLRELEELGATRGLDTLTTFEAWIGARAVSLSEIARILGDPDKFHAAILAARDWKQRQADRAKQAEKLSEELRLARLEIGM